MVTALALVLVTVRVWAALVVPLNVLNARLSLLREMGEVPDVAAEASFTSKGKAFGALSEIKMDPSSTADVGVTVTVTVQFPVLGARGVVKQVPVVTV
jgi:hypothetical protein